MSAFYYGRFDNNGGGGGGTPGSAASAGLVFRPGGVQAGSVFTSWSALYTALQETEGLRFLTFDDTLAPCVVPPGTYDMKNVVWQGRLNIDGFFSSVELTEGVVLTNVNIFTDGLNITFSGTTAPITVTGFKVFFVGKGCKIIGGPSGPMFSLTAATQMIIALDFGAELDTGPYEVIDMPAAGAVIQIIALSLGKVQSDVVRGIAGTVAVLVHGNTSGSVSAAQTNFAGTQQYVFLDALVDDQQHGDRGGGSLHALADGSNAGFLSAADYTLLHNATAAPSVFGDGSDGNAVINTTTSLSRDMYYQDLTVQTGFALYLNGFRLYVNGTLNLEINSSISNSGADGSFGGFGAPAGTIGGGGSGGPAGDGAPGMDGTASGPRALGSFGGPAGDGTAGLGGSGGPFTPPTPTEGSIHTLQNACLGWLFGFSSSGPISGGAGGGGGAGGPTAGEVGGKGGGAGGAAVIAARDMIHEGNINANGGAGESAIGADCGGGGGGGGGVVVLVRGNRTGVGSIQVTGGLGGFGSGAGTDGLPGTDGLVVEIQP